MFRGQFKLTAREEKGLRNVCLFVVLLYIKIWFTAPSAASAPKNDLAFLKALAGYDIVNSAVASVASKKFIRHLWYLSEELVWSSFL